VGLLGRDHTIPADAVEEIFSGLAWTIHECHREAFETEAFRVRGSDDVAGIHE
jgi:hypothetical protein